jgi:glycosyltransferase involved in cell wall biosynthesis
MKSYPIETANRAMAFLVDANALLVVVGTGTEETRLRAIASSVNQTVGQTMIHFTGALSDPRQVYAAADIMLGMGSSAARALAFGAPLIVQGEQGTAELFEPQTATALFRRSFWNPHQEADPTVLLAGLVRRLLDEPRRRGELGGFGRRFAIDNFSLSAMAEKLACVYDQSLGEYGRMDWLRDLNRELPLLARNVSRRLSTARLPK